jgi:hypothetical protein
VNVGLELVAEPSLLFLDEPTSGLDSTASKLVVQVCVHRSCLRLQWHGWKLRVAALHWPGQHRKQAGGAGACARCSRFTVEATVERTGLVRGMHGDRQHRKQAGGAGACDGPATGPNPKALKPTPQGVELVVEASGTYKLVV